MSFINTFSKPLPLPVHSPGHYVTLSARHGVYSPYYAHEWYPIKSAALSPVENVIVVARAAPSRPLLQSRSENYALSTNKLLFILTSSSEEEMDSDLLRIFHFFRPNNTSRSVFWKSSRHCDQNQDQCVRKPTVQLRITPLLSSTPPRPPPTPLLQPLERRNGLLVLL